VHLRHLEHLNKNTSAVYICRSTLPSGARTPEKGRKIDIFVKLRFPSLNRRLRTKINRLQIFKKSLLIFIGRFLFLKERLLSGDGNHPSTENA
jgi:hypothetical protein